MREQYNKLPISYEEHLEAAGQLLELILDGQVSMQELRQDKSFTAYIAGGEYTKIMRSQARQEAKQRKN
ncbi:MAG TPA: hypothetical protein VJL83_04210 [Patescibacteria group bacterium]|nr:hypothetical protein [Patescibacteria group bacterium]